MGPEQMDEIAGMVDAVLKNVRIISDTQYTIDESFKNKIVSQVQDLCSRFPVH
jgi:glycine/serine hydroxymethyltransferase